MSENVNRSTPAQEENQGVIVGRTQEQLLTSVKERLAAHLEQQGMQYQQDGKYIRLRDSGGKQIGIIYDLHEGYTNIAAFYRGQEALADMFGEWIPEDLVWEYRQATDQRDYNFHPKLTTGEVGKLREPIVPIDEHIVVIQGEYAVTTPDDPNPLLTTFGIGPCRGMVVYDMDRPLASIAHADMEWADISLVEQMRKDLVKQGANPERLAFLGTPNIDPMKQQFVISPMFSSASYTLPNDFSFDRQEKKVVPSDIKALSHSTGLERIGDKTDIRMKHHVPYIRSY